MCTEISETLWKHTQYCCGTFCATASFQTSGTAHPATQHHIPLSSVSSATLLWWSQTHKTYSLSHLIVHPVLATLHCEVTARVLAPAEWLRHAVIGTVPACVLHQCQSDAWVNRILRVSPCHGFILKWNTCTAWEGLLSWSSLQHIFISTVQCNVCFQASEGISTVPSVQSYQQTCACMCALFFFPHLLFKMSNTHQKH